MSELFGVSVVRREGRCSLNTLSVSGSAPPACDSGSLSLQILRQITAVGKLAFLSGSLKEE